MEDWDVQYLSSVDIYSGLLFVQGEGGWKAEGEDCLQLNFCSSPCSDPAGSLTRTVDYLHVK